MPTCNSKLNTKLTWCLWSLLPRVAMEGWCPRSLSCRCEWLRTCWVSNGHWNIVYNIMQHLTLCNMKLFTCEFKISIKFCKETINAFKKIFCFKFCTGTSKISEICQRNFSISFLKVEKRNADEKYFLTVETSSLFCFVLVTISQEHKTLQIMTGLSSTMLLLFLKSTTQC